MKKIKINYPLLVGILILALLLWEEYQEIGPRVFYHWEIVLFSAIMAGVLKLLRMIKPPEE
jgi:hypothetical protein